MSRLEDELKKALRRVEPPAGFADRVLARAARQERQKPARSRWWLGLSGIGGLRWAAACAMCIALAASGVLYEHDLQRRRGEEAKDKLMLALRITGTKLQIAQESLKEIDSADQPRQ
jgi:anti-sigma factor RsiW